MGIKEQTFMAAGEKLLIFIHRSTMPTTALITHTLREKNVRACEATWNFLRWFSSNASQKRNNLSFTTEEPSAEMNLNLVIYEKDAPQENFTLNKYKLYRDLSSSRSFGTSLFINLHIKTFLPL